MNLPGKAIFWVGLATALSLLGDQALYALLPIYFEDLGLLPYQVGIILSANRWIRLITNHLAENLLQRLPAMPMFLTSLILGALITASYAFVGSFVVLFVARLLWGLCWSFIRHVSIMIVSTQSRPEQMGQMMGYYNGISRMGSVVGILLGGILFDSLGYDRTFIIFAVASMFAAPLGLLARHGGATVMREDRWYRRDRNPNGYGLLICGFCIGCVGPGLIMSTLGHVLAVRYGDQIDLMGALIGVATLTGLILGSRWILDSLAAPFLGAFVDRLGTATGAPMFFALGTVSLLFLSLFESLAALILGILVFFVAATTLQAVVAGQASKRGSAFYAQYATASDAGAASGPILAWSLLQLNAGDGITFNLGLGFYLVATLVSFRAFARGRADRET